MATAPRTPLSPSETWGQTPAPNPPSPLGPRDVSVPPPDIERGALLVMRQFDLADEIDLRRLQELLPATRQGLTRPRASALVLLNPPVALALGHRTLVLAGTQVEAELSARVFDFGAVSVRLRIALPEGTSWSRLSALVQAAQGDESLTRVAREAAGKLASQIAPAMSSSHESPIFEDYIVAQIERFAPATRPDALPPDAVARMLLGERDDANLAPTEISEALSARSSYYGDDLCVVGWNTALVVEPSGDPDTVDVLEFANAQLLELRYYDELLDRRLGRLYDEVAARRGRGLALLSNYGSVQREAMALILEIAEFIERVENALKIIGDVYLARVYAGAVESLRIPAWERSVNRKQELLHQVYEVLKSEVDASRDQLLEGTIVLLIVFEIGMAMLRIGGG